MCVRCVMDDGKLDDEELFRKVIGITIVIAIIIYFWVGGPNG